MVTLYEDLNQDESPAFILTDASDHYGFVGRFESRLDRDYPYSLNATGATDDLISDEVVFIEDANPILL
jgi:hypothetical protein